MSAIKPYQHQCVIRSSSLEGNTYTKNVNWFDIEYKTICDNCGEILATPEQIIAYIYDELLNPA